MAKFAGPRLPLVMKVLFATQSSVYEVQRVTSTAFLAEVGALALDHESGLGRGSVKSPRTGRPGWGGGATLKTHPRPRQSGPRRVWGQESGEVEERLGARLGLLASAMTPQ